MATYVSAPTQVEAFVLHAMKQYHPELVEHGVTVRVLLAHAQRDEGGEPKGPAIRHHGYPAKALARVNNLRDRVEGKTDATIIIDGDNYKDWPDAELLAICDHELRHFELVTKEDEHGNPVVQLDDANRPRLRIRPHDVELGAFVDVIHRHGRHASEAKAIRDAQRFIQGVFDFPAAATA